MCFFRGVVMRHRAVGVERGDGVETQGDEVRPARAGGGQVLVDGQLGDALAPPGPFQPGEELT
ncbi:hypothetical protein D3C76_1824680 [compost metagenome]